MLLEVLFNVEDHGLNKYTGGPSTHEGCPLYHRPAEECFYLDKGQLTKWFNTGKLPASIASIPVKTWKETDPNENNFGEILSLDRAKLWDQWMGAVRSGDADPLRRYAKAQAAGGISNWGFQDLKLHGVVAVEMPPEDIPDLFRVKEEETGEFEEGEPVMALLAKSKWAVRETLFSTKEKKSLKQKGKSVPPMKAAAPVKGKSKLVLEYIP